MTSSNIRTSGSQPEEEIFLLRAATTSVLVDARGQGLPVVVHWGADLGGLSGRELESACSATMPGVPSNSIDEPRRVHLLPQHATGYAGRATLIGSRAHGAWSPLFAKRRCLRDDDDGDGSGQRLLVSAVDQSHGLELTSDLRLSAAGVLRLRHAIRNIGDTDYGLLALPAILPVPAHARELLDLTGRHLKERVPQRLFFGFGSWVREQRRGRTGHDAPLVLAAGTPNFGFRRGEVWAIHVGWSGDSTTFAERLPEGWSGLGGGELLQPTEINLQPGDAYTAPWLHCAYSGHGLDGISDAHHQNLRARPSHPVSPRPVVLNTWEAVYFDHDLARLSALADAAAYVGVERFVLDDGWFGARRSDGAGLGDWFVSTDLWPEGLHPLVEHVIRLGMDFGLWVEPEMINPDSDLARTHPDWLLAHPERTPPPARRQQVLDVANPQAYAYLLERLDALLTEYPIAFLKWDHNRDLVDAVHSGVDGRRPGVHAQTAAVYRLLDELRGRHPAVEIESCAGGGGRVDLGVLQHTDRIWTSDCNDPLERQHIQRWTGLLVPPELMGAHIGPPHAHTTGRTSDLSFRAGTALFGHLGIEWDLTAASTDDLNLLSDWIAAYKQFRPLLHTGRVVRADTADDAVMVHGVVSPTGDEALFACVQLTTTISAPPAPIRLPGLYPQRSYRLLPVAPSAAPLTIGTAPPPWWTQGEVTLPGRVLSDVGLAALLLGPEQLVLLHASAD